MMAMIVTVALGFLLEPLPRSVLGALVIVNLKGMLMQFREIHYLWRRDKPECVVWVGTCLGATLLGLDLGLAVGLGVELFTVVFRIQFPCCSVLANIPRTDLYRNRKDYLNMIEHKGVKILRMPSPIFFANIEFFRDKLAEAVGFNPLRVLRKRNKALRKLKKMLKGNDDRIAENGLGGLFCQTTDESYTNKEEMDLPLDLKNLPFSVDWNTDLPFNISVPRVDLHSLILDFSAVSFLDVSALKGLKTALKELIRVDVDIYIVSCDEIRTSMFFVTIHDAMLHILEQHKDGKTKNWLKETRF
ncbi:hypothetical protein Q5P01_003350 [Channa striata]|uniref:STAS domain-containing protein n=1 Tax=Channa striata TaxID=64152 RepID=A0AA88NLY4_CHASR|nr:hypothetical protein Q5P01_003350 [Channa striata]